MNPLKAKISPAIYKYGITFPMFYIEAISIMQLLKERPEFNEPFMMLPSLTGPVQRFGFDWLHFGQLSNDTMPYL